jgi:hypothetical protein
MPLPALDAAGQEPRSGQRPGATDPGTSGPQPRSEPDRQQPSPLLGGPDCAVPGHVPPSMTGAGGGAPLEDVQVGWGGGVVGWWWGGGLRRAARLVCRQLRIGRAASDTCLCCCAGQPSCPAGRARSVLPSAKWLTSAAARSSGGARSSQLATTGPLPCARPRTRCCLIACWPSRPGLTPSRRHPTASTGGAGAGPPPARARP